jgi:histidinol-phosphate aminotransferase
MTLPSMSRRQFGRTLGAAVGTAVVADRLPPAAGAGPAKDQDPDLVRLDSNENPYGPSDAALAAMTRAQAVASRYPDGAEREMGEALARAHGVTPDRIVLGCGSSDILRMADSAFLDAGKTVVAAEPTFEAVLAYARVTRAEAVKVPLTADFRHDLVGMAAACDARTGLVYVCNPNNPTGTTVAAEALEAFLGKVPPATVVLVDEAYHHFVEDPAYRTATSLVDRFPNLVVARTFSKIHGMAGMRLGYAVSSAANAKALGARASWSNANAAVLAAARTSLEDEAHLARQRELLNGTRRWLCRELERDGRRYIPSEANFMMIEVGGDVQGVIDALRARKVLVGRRFPSLSSWLRVTIGTPAETSAFLAALRAVVPVRAAA